MSVRKVVWTLSVLWLTVVLSRAVFSEETIPWQKGVPTRLVENDTVFENDLVYVPGNGQNKCGYYPQAAVVQWGPISPKQPGRYRAGLRARIEKAGPANLVFQAWVPQEHGGPVIPTGLGCIPVPVASIRMNGYCFDSPGEWQQFVLDFDVESTGPVMVGVMYVGGKESKVGKVQVEKKSLRLEKLNVPVSISRARSGKIRYHLADEGVLEVRLTSAVSEPKDVEVTPIVIDEFETKVPGSPQKLTVPPFTTVESKAPFAVPGREGGYEALVELTVDGNKVDARGDVFAVSDSPYQFMQLGNLQFPHHLAGSHGLGAFKKNVMDRWEEYVKDCKSVVERMRGDYSTCFEYFAWAEEDSMKLTTDTDEPYLTGQKYYAVSRKQTLMLNDLMKKHGIAVSAYVNYCPFGYLGFELVRRCPEWFAYDKRTGQLQAGFDTFLMEKYFSRPPEQIIATYPVIGVNCGFIPSPVDGKTFLDYHIEQMTQSARMYGWESWRYDAGPLSIKEFPIVREKMAKLVPPVWVGNNMGTYLLGREPSEAWKVFCSGGSLMMEEATRKAVQSPTDPYRTWERWTEWVRLGSKLTRSHGGHYTYIHNNGNWLATAFGYAVGGHPWGNADSGWGENRRFMIRYGYHFWDLRTKLLDDAENIVSVSSSRPLWWKMLVSERVLDGNHRQVIVPLINPPAEKEVVGATPVGPATGVKVVFKGKGEKEDVSAYLLSPEPVVRRIQLAIRQTSAGLEVDVPRFLGWANVVFDCRKKQ